MNIHLALIIVTVFAAFDSFAATITLDSFDQQKVALFLGELPLRVRARKTTRVDAPVRGKNVKNVLTLGGLKIECNSLYYLTSPHATSETCKVMIDLKGEGVSQKNQEIRVEVKDPEMVSAIYKTIPYGQAVKGIWGWERDYGTNYDGVRSPLFHVRLKCTKEACHFFFSSFNLVP